MSGDTSVRFAARLQAGQTIRLVPSRINLAQRYDFAATTCLSRGFVIQLQELFELEGSPLFAQFIQNCGPRPEAAGSSRLQGCRKSLVKGGALRVREVVTLVVCDEINDRAFAQSGRFVEYDTSVLDACSQRGHARNIRAWRMTYNGKYWTTNSTKQGEFGGELLFFNHFDFVVSLVHGAVL